MFLPAAIIYSSIRRPGTKGDEKDSSYSGWIDGEHVVHGQLEFGKWHRACDN
jgi:hypothetical protein